MKRIIILLAVVIVGIAVAQQVKNGKLNSFIPSLTKDVQEFTLPSTTESVVYQESTVTKVVEDSLHQS